MAYDFKTLVRNEFRVADINEKDLPEPLLHAIETHCLMWEDKALSDHIYHLDEIIESEEMDEDEIPGFNDLYQQVIVEMGFAYIRLIA